MNKYRVSLQCKGESHPSYHVGAEGWNEETAIFEAKRFVAESGYWPSQLSTKERMECLTVTKVVKTGVDKCQYYVLLNDNKNNCLCMAYSESKRSDGLHWSHYPNCNDENCPLKHPELLNDRGVIATLETE